MSDKVDVTGTIKIVDEATGPINAINRQIGQMAQQVRAFGDRIRAAMNTGAFGGVAANLQKVGGAFGRLQGMARGAIRSIATLSGLGAGFSIAGMAQGLQDFMDKAKPLTLTAAALHTTASNLDALHAAALAAGVGVESFDNAMEVANLNIGKAAAGKNKDLAALFKKLNIKTEGKASVDILNQMADAIARQKDAGVQARMAQAFLGKGWKEMLPMMLKGSKGMQEAMARAKDMGLVMSEEDIKLALAAKAAQAEVKKSFTSVAMEITRAVLPGMTAMNSAIRDFIRENRQPIRANIKQFGEWLSSINWKQNLEDMKAWLTEIGTFVDKIGGAKTVMIAFGLYLAGPLISALASLGVAFVTLGAAILTATWPVALFVLGIIAVAAAAALIYAKWGTIGPWLTQLWNDPGAAAEEYARRVKAAFASVDWNAYNRTLIEGFRADVQSIFDALNKLETGFVAFAAQFIPDAIKEKWNDLNVFFRDVFARVRQEFDNATGWLKDWIKQFNPANWDLGWGRFNVPGSGLPTPGAAPAPAPGGVLPGPRLGSLIPSAIGAGAGPGGMPNGQVNVNVAFANAPPGTRSRVDSSGRGVRATGDVGWSMAT